MKLVSSAKLRKAQNAIAAMRPYQEALESMLAAVEIPGQAGNDVMPGTLVMPGTDRASQPRVIVAIASNSSLCGGFNSNVIAKVRSVRKSGDIVYSIGRKMADAMSKDGFPSPEDLSALAEHPSYAAAASLVEKLSQDLDAGRIGSVTLVYTHFVSSARQVPVVENLLPFVLQSEKIGQDPSQSDVIIEPSASELQAVLIPKTLKLKLFAAIGGRARGPYRCHAHRNGQRQPAAGRTHPSVQQGTPAENHQRDPGPRRRPGRAVTPKCTLQSHKKSVYLRD